MKIKGSIETLKQEIFFFQKTERSNSVILVLPLLSNPKLKKNSFVGSIGWMAPEVVAGGDYDYKIDIWSLGITAIEIAQGKSPFASLTIIDTMRHISNDEAPKLKNNSDWDLSFVEFVSSCLVKEPKDRPDATTILKQNKKFFSFAKDQNYIKEKLLKGIPTVDERFGKVYSLPDEEGEEKQEEGIKWNFDIEEEINIKDKEKEEQKIYKTESKELHDKKLFATLKNIFNDDEN